MKPRHKTTEIFVVMILVLTSISSCGYNQANSSRPNAEVYPQPAGPSCEDPLCGGEKVSFTQAQAKTSYSIPAPEGFEIKQVWGYTQYGNQKYPYPGSVGWWEDGLDITLYSDTLSLEELLKIAETVH